MPPQKSPPAQWTTTMQCYPFIHSDDGTTPPVENLRLVCANDCPAKDVEWLWPGKIPIGKVTLLIGDPGIGKSLVALDIAARLSRGAAWPDQCSRHTPCAVTCSSHTPCAVTEPDSIQGDKERGRQGESSADRQISLSPCLAVSPSSTIILSASDDLADVIRPRLDAAGADPRRIFVVTSIRDLRNDFDQLRFAVNCPPDCRLIIIDPINAFVGPGDCHFHSVVSKVLAPLAKLAAEKRVAVLAIANLRKTDGAAIYRAAGSMGFVASAQAIWAACRDHENPARHLLLPLKNNLGPTNLGLAYSIKPRAPLGAAVISWHVDPILTSGHEALSAPEITDLNRARNWLQNALANGPRPASEITQEAAHYDFHERTLRRALHAIGGQTQNRGFLEGWWWSIPKSKAEGGGEKAEGQDKEQIMPLSSRPTLPSTFSTSPSEFEIPTSTFPLPPSLEPVPLCPLPEISDIFGPSPALDPSPARPTVRESIHALKQLDRGRRPDNCRKTKSATRRNKKTGQSILHQLIDALSQPHPDRQHKPQPTAPDSS